MSKFWPHRRAIGSKNFEFCERSLSLLEWLPKFCSLQSFLLLAEASLEFLGLTTILHPTLLQHSRVILRLRDQPHSWLNLCFLTLSLQLSLQFHWWVQRITWCTCCRPIWLLGILGGRARLEWQAWERCRRGWIWERTRKSARSSGTDWIRSNKWATAG